MGRRAVQRPKHLAAKLLAIRQNLALSQPQMAKLLGGIDYYHRLSEFESGRRVPNLIVLLAYARAAGISTDDLIDDEVTLTKESASMRLKL
jgi:transcriptional regulator with XRE-family HTH domain